MSKAPVQIDVWSDYVCPFCYLAEPTLAEIKKEFGSAVEIHWRAFELRPDPIPTLDPKGDYLREIWQRAVYPMAERRGMTLRLPPVQPRSRLAHEAVAFAHPHGCSERMNHALFRAFFEQGEDLGNTDVLVNLGAGLGLNEKDLRTSLAEGIYRPGVIEDERLAAELGIAGVPAILVRNAKSPMAEATLIEGAQPLEIIRRSVQEVLEFS